MKFKIQTNLLDILSTKILASFFLSSCDYHCSTTFTTLGKVTNYWNQASLIPFRYNEKQNLFKIPKCNIFVSTLRRVSMSLHILFLVVSFLRMNSNYYFLDKFLLGLMILGYIISNLLLQISWSASSVTAYVLNEANKMCNGEKHAGKKSKVKFLKYVSNSTNLITKIGHFPVNRSCSSFSAKNATSKQ